MGVDATVDAVEKLHLEPGDVLVLRFAGMLDLEVVESLMQQWRTVLDGLGLDNKVVGVDGEAIRLEVEHPSGD